MSVWQYIAAVDGYVRANSENDGKLGAKEVDELWAWLQEAG